MNNPTIRLRVVPALPPRSKEQIDAETARALAAEAQLQAQIDALASTGTPNASSLVLNGPAPAESYIVARRGTDEIRRGFRWTSDPFVIQPDNCYPVFN